MALLRTNILTNYAGQAWIAIMAVAFVPAYLRILGMEAFGLIGLMLSIQAMSLLFDVGMGGMLNRELARRTATPATSAGMTHLVRTLEWMVWPMAMLIGVIIAAAATWLATHWLHTQSIDEVQTRQAIILIGIAVAMQWPASFYSNGLSGLECQATANAINAGFATLRSAGVVAVLLWVSPTLQAFMVWYALVGGAHSVVAAFALWRALPRVKARFTMAELDGAWSFAGGLALVTALSIGLIQMDRVIVSALRPLADVGYLTVALTVVAGLGRIVQPMFTAIYPRFSRLVAAGAENALSQLYHESNQYLAVVVSATAAVLAVHAGTVVYLWTGNAATAAIVAAPLAFLTLGGACNGLMNIPYALQLAHGWTGLTVRLNAACLIVGIPATIVLVSSYGIVGASWVWLGINLCYLGVGVPVMHQRLLPGHVGQWLFVDILPPAVVAALVACACGWLLPTPTRTLAGVALLAAESLATLLATAMATPVTRARVIALARRMTFPARHA